jgi:hypothetical protein
VQLAKFYSNSQGDFQGIATKASEFNECLFYQTQFDLNMTEQNCWINQ